MAASVEQRIRPALPADLPGIETLLASFDLPTVGVDEQLGGFVVAEDGGAIVASAGLEVYGRGALLRSVAVRPDYQGRGLARTLVRHLLERGRADGIERVFLLTTTAAEFFRRMGFEAIDDFAVDSAVRASKEFGDCCCVGAQTMKLNLGGTS
ncbi:MAG TPA: arsenic resistance N-acetyltransferase ArsN2 [bacterium]|jgi:amino-acid N-acetyltransferase|nr:arsenic resistance N-acetyltransferase ArsN2 [bacterium]